MPRRLLVAGLVLALDLVVVVPATRADLFCEQPVCHAGQVRNGVPLERRFTLVNRGTEPLEIVDLRSTCGCLTPQLERRTLSSGEMASLLLQVNTLALAEGTQSWRTRVVYREGVTLKDLELVIVGDVVTEVLVQPSALTLPADVTGGHEITVTDRRPSPLTIRAADTGTPFLRASVTRPERDGGVTVQKVCLEVPADCPAGRHDLVVHLYSDDPVYRELKVPVTVVKRPRQRVTPTPRQVTLEGDRGRPWPARVVRLSAADGTAVEVERADADHPAIHCAWEKDTVSLRVDPTRLSGDLQTTVRVRFCKPAGETAEVAVLCVVR
jgi:hypothetical protein